MLQFRLGIMPVIVMTIILAGCATAQTSSAASACSGPERYFPAGTFPAGYPGSDLQRRQWYSTVLARLDEPSLSCDGDVGDSYRLIWLSSLAHPVVIRVSRRGERIVAEAFQLSGTGGGDPGGLLHRVERPLSVTDWNRIETAVRLSDFWQLPTSGNLYGAHGEQWIVEGRRGDRYHVVDRWSPQAGRYRDLAVLLFDLVEWERPHSSRY